MPGDRAYKKKAVEYYQQKGLISPEIRENGYRYFSQGE